MGDSYTEALLTEARNAIDNTDPANARWFIRNEAMLHLIMVSMNQNSLRI